VMSGLIGALEVHLYQQNQQNGQNEQRQQAPPPRTRQMYTAPMTGHQWIHEMLSGHVDRSYRVFRLHPAMFIKLRDILISTNGIKDTRGLSANEQLAMFLYTVGHGTASRSICEHFQHSSETVSRYVNKVTQALCDISDMFI